jgi:cardiolipin synthase A/B
MMGERRNGAGHEALLNDERLARALSRVGAAPLRVGNQLTLLKDGPDTYDDWLRAIAQAQRWVHLENYIFKADSTGRRFAEALIERAQAGVAVRVLYDWFGSLGVSPSFWRTMRQAGVDVRPFNPPTVGAPLDAVQRDHRKSICVDGDYGSLGGVCIADEWLMRSPDTGLPYRDTAVRVLGPAVHDLERAFARVWARTGSPLPPDEQPGQGDVAPVGDTSARVIIQEPGRMRMLRLLQLMTATVAQRLWIADAYFLAAPILREALMAAARDGVDVRILLPSTNDLVVVGALSRYGYRSLLEAGVRIWEYAGPMMHAKTTVADGWWSRVGSTNMNITGLLTNWELDIVAEDRRFGAAMEKMFEHDLASANEVRLTGARRQPRVQSAGFGRRAERRALRLARGRGSSASAALGGAGGAVLQAASSDALGRHERLVGAAIGGSLLAASVLSARFPRPVVWPLATLGAAFGGVTLVRALRGTDGTKRRRLRRARPQRWRNRRFGLGRARR